MRTPAIAADGALTALTGGGEMGALIRAFDWSKTPVGPVECWPQSLRTALSILLETGFPMYIAWGPEFTQFYNDGYRPILGSTKHPALGKGTPETFPEIWDIIGPMFRGVMAGTPTTVVDFLLPLDRHGFVEECYFIFSYSPIREESGGVGGVLVTVTETTSQVIGRRRLETSQALAARTQNARTVAEACALAAEVLASNPADLPFAAIYLLDQDDLSSLQPWPIAEVVATRRPQVVEPLPEGVWPPDKPEMPQRALVLPILQPGGERVVGVLVAGTSPRLMLDEAYRDFLALLASQVGSAIASARALAEAKARADALAELDRAKTAFFSNVSHEFRTPLTLMLGPTEEALASQQRALVGDDLEAVYRNARRLLKLVNTLLDFSRIESGRVQASYEPVDLAALTTDLASAFRSAIERAGLHLVVDCPELPQLVYVDREMWEKIVLNLLSNAFKYTLDGAITVSLRCQPEAAVLTVRDTGVGIDQSDLSRVFERFHRVNRSRARTHEGTGIGLALVKELVGLHGGTIEAESAPGEGSVFTVWIPTGSAHLPADKIQAAKTLPSTSAGAQVYVEEALRWLPGSSTLHPPAESAARTPVRIVIADDNADMREYLVRLLGERWTIEAVGDGRAALEAVRLERTHLVPNDVMMPELDGFELLRRLREDEATRSIPVILLSARAGEESRVDALEAGADDYLVKPFAARELVARVQAQIVRSKVQTLEQAQALRLTGIFQNAPVGVAILDGPEHVFEFANRAYLALVGDRPITGQPIRAALPELQGQGIFELLDQVYTSGEPYIGRSLRVMIERGGALEECFFNFVYQPLLDDEQVTGIAVIVFEVTELTRARQEAEAANRAKDEFLAMLGHELRNPLAPIQTALQLLRLRGVQGAEREQAIIERQVKHLVSLVDDLLDVSRIARGKVQLRQERLELADAVGRAVEMTLPAFEERGQGLVVEVPRGIEIYADPARLSQVFANLLSNAAKYSEPGGTVRVWGWADGGWAELSVVDTGVGISAEMLPAVFDLFAQERQGFDRSQGGLGLGLAIVRSLVTAHGGTVSAHSEGKGKGAEFRVRLPLAGRSAAPEPPGPKLAAQGLERAAGRRVLVVDDNRDAANLLGETLRALGHTARVAYDGPTALALAGTFRPEVVLLDLGLPVMDGFEVARQLRADPALSSLELVALSGYGQEPYRQRTRELGFSAHLTKPVELERLDGLLRGRLSSD